MTLWAQYKNCYSNDDSHYEYYDDDEELIILDAGQKGVTTEQISMLKKFHREELSNEERIHKKRWIGESTKRMVISYDALRKAALDGTDVLADPLSDPAIIFEKQASTEQIQSLLMHMKPEQRELLWRYFFDGATETEIAQREGVTQQAIQGRVYKARNKFCKFLEKMACNLRPKSLKG